MPQCRVLVGGIPIEELPPEKRAAVRKYISAQAQAAFQRWVDNHFQAMFEEEMEKIRQGL